MADIKSSYNNIERFLQATHLKVHIITHLKERQHTMYKICSIPNVELGLLIWFTHHADYILILLEVQDKKVC